MKYKIFIFSLLSIFFLSCQKNDSLISKVDPFIGTGGHGHTYPGASLPFGMVQLSPDTRVDDWDGCSGYHYSDDHILGFSHTHLSGTGVGDYGDIRIMPTVGDLYLNPGSKEHSEEGYISKFSHDKEMASPGYYQVYLDDYQINAELTASKRVGFHQYSFPKSEEAHIILDLKEAVRTETIHELQINIENNHTVSGLRRSGSWAKDQYCYFVIDFSKDFKDSGIQVDGKKQRDLKQAQGKDLKAWFDFDTKKGEKVLVKVALSAISIEGARNNLYTEIPDWDFRKVKENAEIKWTKELSKIVVKGVEKDKKIFYTSLYHSLLTPNTWSDVDGKYRGHDLKIHEADHDIYTVFSLWDTFRAEHPLLTILHPERANDMIKSMLLMEKYGNLLPVWELAANETGCMIGYHSIPVIYDAYSKGIGDFDASEALRAMVKSADQDKLGLKSYKKYGYVKADIEGESVSRTLEYAYDDWCIAMMAKDLGQDSIYSRFIKRAQNYKNIFDPRLGFMRAKINGEWQKPFDPAEVNFHFTEGNSWQYSMFVPQDINGLIALHGGDTAFETKLDELFETETKLSGREQADITGLIGQYAHGNEPSHHMAYLYNYVGKPWKSQKILAKIMNELYHDQADGLSGNEDCGQMSAWYVLSSMGFYPVTPGSTNYVFGTPIFNEVKLQLKRGENLIIKATNLNKENIYIQSIVLDNEDYNKSYITHQDLMNAKTIEFVMGKTPNRNFGSEIANRPSALISDHIICPTPTIETKGITFSDKTIIKMQSPLTGAQIYYTTDGSTPTTKSKRYTEPFSITKSTLFLFRAYHKKEGYSPVIDAKFYKIDDSKAIELTNAYSPMYPAGGDNALIDQIRGSENFKTGTWQGFYNTPLEAIISFKKKTKITKISIGFIQDQGAWVFFPKNVSFYTSNNKKDWILAAKLDNTIDKKAGPLVHDFSIQVYPKKVKYVKIIAENAGPCPEWHLGAGGDTWLFADEIVIE